MNSKFLPVVLLSLGVAVGATAQADKTEKKEKENITIQRDKDSKEKMTIVIDGDNITVNGKPLDELKGENIRVMRGKTLGPIGGFRSLSIPRGGVKMFDEGFPFNSSGNKAVLGVMSKKDDKGALITSVEENSAAEKAGLKKEDIITKVGSTKIADSDELYDAIGDYKPEDKITITYLRDGKEAQATATLGKRKNVEIRSFDLNGDNFKRNFDGDFNFKMPRMEGLDKFEGFEINPYSFSRKPRLGLEIQDAADGKGVKILDVDDESAAEKAGLKKDDLITEVDGKAVNSVDDLKKSTKELKEGNSVKITYQRAGKSQTATISFPKKLKTAEL